MIDEVNYSNKINEYWKEYKRNPYVINLIFLFGSIIFGILLLSIMSILNSNSNMSIILGIVLVINAFIFAGSIYTMGKSQTKKNENLKNLYKEIKILITNDFCKKFNLSEEDLNNELPIINNLYHIFDISNFNDRDKMLNWFLYIDSIKIIKEALIKRDEVYNECSSIFNITPIMLAGEIQILMKTYSSKIINNSWWAYEETINFVKAKLSEKYKNKDFNNQKQDLTLENLKLKNESIAIDNTQKKFWTCQFCGNMNRADDMSCIKCGGIRAS